MKKLAVLLIAVLLMATLGGCELIGNLDNTSAPANTPHTPSTAGTTTAAITEGTTTTANADGTTTVGATTTTMVNATPSASVTASTTDTTKVTTASAKPTTVIKTTPSSKKPTTTTAKKPTTTSTKKPTTTTTTTKKPTTTPAGGSLWSTMAADVLPLVNAERQKNGAAPLTMDTGLMMQAAEIRVKEAATQFSHTRPNGTSCFTVFDELNIQGYYTKGENLAAGHTSAAAVFTGWMNSEGHRANMMNTDFTHISIACYQSGGRYYWVQLFGGKYA